MSNLRSMRAPLLAVALVVLVIAAAPAGAHAQQPASSDSSTLYARLGGYDFIARFVDTAFPRVASQPQLSRLFRGHSRDSQMRQRQLIVDALCHHTGGPCLYIGRDLTKVHEGLGVTDADWEAFMSVITGALEELGVATDAREGFVELFETRLRPTVVLK